MNPRRAWPGYVWAAVATAACTAVGASISPRFDLVNVAMVYLLAVVVIAWRFTRGAAVFTSVICVAAFDFFFVPPQGTFSVDDSQYLLTFTIMLGVALLISGLAQSVRRESEEKTRLAIDAETERIRSALLASISHDLRTPLAVMSGASSSLAERGESLGAEERRALARSVYDQAREMSERVTKVLQMTRLETGGIRLTRDWVSIGELTGAVLHRLEERFSQHRLMIEVSGDLPLVLVDAVLVEQALGNLLENAAKHTPPGTVVRLRALAHERELVVSVEDVGGGLPDEDLERVFAKFHHGAIGNAPGMGLGLAICRAIVALHGGRAWAERLSGGGMAFRFTLPIESVPAIPAEIANA